MDTEERPKPNGSNGIAEFMDYMFHKLNYDVDAHEVRDVAQSKNSEAKSKKASFSKIKESDRSVRDTIHKICGDTRKNRFQMGYSLKMPIEDVLVALRLKRQTDHGFTVVSDHYFESHDFIRYKIELENGCILKQHYDGRITFSGSNCNAVGDYLEKFYRPRPQTSSFTPNGKDFQIPQAIWDLLIVLHQSGCLNSQPNQSDFLSIDRANLTMLYYTNRFLAPDILDKLYTYPIYKNSVSHLYYRSIILTYFGDILKTIDSLMPELQYRALGALTGCMQIYCRSLLGVTGYSVNCTSLFNAIPTVSEMKPNGTRAIATADSIGDLLIAFLMLKLEGNDIPTYEEFIGARRQCRAAKLPQGIHGMELGWSKKCAMRVDKNINKEFREAQDEIEEMCGHRFNASKNGNPLENLVEFSSLMFRKDDAADARLGDCSVTHSTDRVNESYHKMMGALDAISDEKYPLNDHLIQYFKDFTTGFYHDIAARYVDETEVKHVLQAMSGVNDICSKEHLKKFFSDIYPSSDNK